MAVEDKYLIQDTEVLYPKDAITTTNRADIQHLQELASCNPRKRIRLCAHANAGDPLHEMLIIHERGAYVRPHKHLGKTESTHIIEGQVDVVIFDDVGNIVNVIHMGDYTSGMKFYYRMAIPLFHTLIIRTGVLVFHETTNGPFNRSNTIFAPWAPEDDDRESVEAFISDLDRRARFL
jgi:cupin fold WbuC family metalloprotein